MRGLVSEVSHCVETSILEMYWRRSTETFATIHVFYQTVPKLNQNVHNFHHILCKLFLELGLVIENFKRGMYHPLPKVLHIVHEIAHSVHFFPDIIPIFFCATAPGQIYSTSTINIFAQSCLVE